MLTEAVLTKIQEAMQDKDFAKLVMEEKTEEGIATLLKDKKGIVVSVEDINDLTHAVKELTERDLEISGGLNPTVENIWKGSKAAFGFGDNPGDLKNSLTFESGPATAAGTYGAYTLAATALAAITYGGSKLVPKIWKKIKNTKLK